MKFDGFDWNDGNTDKCQKHGVSIDEIESLFQNAIAILPDATHSQKERRYRGIGRTRQGRYVFLVFTLRHSNEAWLIRPISARFMHLKEVKAYEKENPDLQK